MSYTIKHFTKEERKAFVEAHELAEPKEWAVMDESFVYEFFDTEEEAKDTLATLVREGKITDLFENWVAETADSFNLPEATIQ